MKRLSATIKKPWGNFVDLAEEKNKWHVKVINLKKGKRLSLQKHKLRNELWVVAEGKIQAIVDNEVFTLTTHDAALIKKGQVHRMTALVDSSIVEITYGVHNEKDIVRLEDDFGRIESKPVKKVKPASKSKVSAKSKPSSRKRK